MKRSRLFSLWLLVFLATSLLRAGGLAVGEEIDPVTGLVTWGPLLTRLAAKRAIYATFVEERYFPFKKTASVLEGEMRFAPDLGLSLCYTKPDLRMVILDDRGIVLRDGKGREKSAPNDAQVPEMARSMMSIFQFDFELLRSNFIVRGNREGDDWRIDLEPRNKAIAKSLGWISIVGQGDQIRHLQFKRAENQRVEISIRQTHELEAFSPADRKRFFRN